MGEDVGKSSEKARRECTISWRKVFPEFKEVVELVLPIYFFSSSLAPPTAKVCGMM